MPCPQHPQTHTASCSGDSGLLRGLGLPGALRKHQLSPPQAGREKGHFTMSVPPGHSNKQAGPTHAKSNPEPVTPLRPWGRRGVEARLPQASVCVPLRAVLRGAKWECEATGHSLRTRELAPLPPGPSPSTLRTQVTGALSAACLPSSSGHSTHPGRPSESTASLCQRHGSHLRGFFPGEQRPHPGCLDLDMTDPGGTPGTWTHLAHPEATGQTGGRGAPVSTMTRTQPACTAVPRAAASGWHRAGTCPAPPGTP